jgi:hypothetical protein
MMKFSTAQIERMRSQLPSANERLPQNGCKFIPRPVRDGSLVRGSDEQYVRVILSELNLDQVTRALVNTPAAMVINKAVELTIGNTPHDKQAVENWIEKFGKGQEYSFSEAIANQICSCFHRAVYFNILMTALAIPSTISAGFVIESPDRVNTDRDANVHRSCWGFSKIDHQERHAWNLIYFGGQHILVDPGSVRTVAEKPIIRQIEFAQQSDSPKTRKYIFAVMLPDGKYRYYQSSQQIFVI